MPGACGACAGVPRPRAIIVVDIILCVCVRSSAVSLRVRASWGVD